MGRRRGVGRGDQRGVFALRDGALVAIAGGGDLDSTRARLGADFFSMITSGEVTALHAVMEGTGGGSGACEALYEQTLRRLTLDVAAPLKRKADKRLINRPDPAMATERFLGMAQGRILDRSALGVGPLLEAERRRHAEACAVAFIRGCRVGTVGGSRAF